MTLLLIIAAATFTAVAGYRLVAPFLISRDDHLRVEVLEADLRRVEELVARRSTLVQALRDIEFDHETGKLTDPDFEALQTRYERRAARVMHELDQLHGGRGWESAIDARLEQRRDQLRRPQPTRSPRPAADRQTCPDCGNAVAIDARFCSQCGTTLSADASTQDAAAAGLDTAAIAGSGSEVAT